MTNKIYYREVRGKVGFFGAVWRFLLVGWQILMLLWFWSYTASVTSLVESQSSDAGSLGATIGMGISWAYILFVWVCGTIILGLFVLLTRPPRILVPRE